MNLYKITAKIKGEQWEIILNALTPETALDDALNKATAQLNVGYSDIAHVETIELGEDQWMRLNGQPELFDTNHFTHTVYCFADKTKTAHFTKQSAAVTYANKLLRQKLRCKIFKSATARVLSNSGRADCALCGCRSRRDQPAGLPRVVDAASV